MDNKFFDKKEKLEKLWKEYAKARNDFEKDFNMFNGINTDFQQQLTHYIKEKNTTAEGLAFDLDIEPATLSRYRQGHFSPSMQTLIGICMVLGLDMKQAAGLLGTLGFCFSANSKDNYAYMYLISNHRGASRAECNKILTGLGVEERYHLYPRKKRKSA